MKLLLVTLLLGMCALNAFSQSPAGLPPIQPGVAHDLAVWRAAHYSDVRYKLNLTLEKMSPVLKGTLEIRVTVGTTSPSDGTPTPPSASPASAGGVPPIILDWRKVAGHEKNSTISNVSLNGVALSPPAAAADGGVRAPYEESTEHLIFRDGVVPGENVIKLDFTSPILTSGSAITRYIDKEDGSEYIYSLFVPSDASTAFPVFDQPDLKVMFSLTVIGPEEWKVISNESHGLTWGEGEPEGSIRRAQEDEICGGGEKCPPGYKRSYPTARNFFSETKPISTYVFAFAAGPWEEFCRGGSCARPSSEARSATDAAKAPRGQAQDLPLQPTFYVRKSQAAKFQPHAAEVFKLTRDGIKYLEDYFDFKFPWPKYDLVLIPEFPFGGMEHAGATFLSERGVIFPSEPTANDYISRANLIFHETAHQWFGDTVTMRWFDDLWLKEGFAEFMAYKTLEKTMPQYNAWKAFYERNKPAAYFTDSTRGTTPIYQPIDNLSAAKSAYGNIVYRKAPSFLRQAEFYLGPDKFQTAVRTFLKKHAFANATWQDLVSEFEAASGQDLKQFAHGWVEVRGGPRIKSSTLHFTNAPEQIRLEQYSSPFTGWQFKTQIFSLSDDGQTKISLIESRGAGTTDLREPRATNFLFVFPNYQDYGYGIFLLDDKSRDYVLKNIQNEKDDFLRSMMWGALWDSVREAELDPREYVELAIKNLPTEKDETITASVLGRVSTAMTYYMDPGADLQSRLEAVLIDRMRTAPTLGQRITYYRALLNIVSTENGRGVLKDMLKKTGGNPSGSEGVSSGATKNTLPTGRVSASAAEIPLKTKDRFDIVTRLAILGDPDATKLLADLEKTETSDDAKRYAYAAHAAFATKENREKFWNDFVNNKDISESWIEAAMNPFNSPRHSDLSLPYLQRSLAELPNLKRNRKIFFVNGWLGAFIGGQKSQGALNIVNKFLADNPNLDRDLRLKILENVDVIERAVKIRTKWERGRPRPQ